MVLGILAVIAILAIAVYHTTQGLFSSLIMALITALCAAFAFNLYRPLAATMYPKHAPYAMALCLMALFAGSVMVLRVVIDIVLRPNVIFHEWVDRIGGGVLGFFVGMMIVGTAMVTLQLLPFGRSVLGYKPFDETLRRRQHLGPFRPDEFVLGMVSALSRGGPGGGGNFAADHGEFALRTFCYRNRAGHQVDTDCPADSVELVGVWQLPPDHPWLARVKDGDETTLADLANPLLTDEQNAKSRIVIVRVAVDASLAEKKRAWKLPATSFQLIYFDGRSFCPLAYLTYPSGDDAGRFRDESDIHWRLWAAESATDPATRKQRLKVADLIVLREIRTESRRESDGRLVIDWVYVLPAVETPAEEDKPDPADTGEDETDTPEADEPELAPSTPVPAAPPMLLVFRRGIEIEIRGPRVGQPPKEDALSHKRRPARGAR